MNQRWWTKLVIGGNTWCTDTNYHLTVKPWSLMYDRPSTPLRVLSTPIHIQATSYMPICNIGYYRVADWTEKWLTTNHTLLLCNPWRSSQKPGSLMSFCDNSPSSQEKYIEMKFENVHTYYVYCLSYNWYKHTYINGNPEKFYLILHPNC